jgi:hypothetical protein
MAFYSVQFPAFEKDAYKLAEVFLVLKIESGVLCKESTVLNKFFRLILKCVLYNLCYSFQWPQTCSCTSFSKKRRAFPDMVRARKGINKM